MSHKSGSKRKKKFLYRAQKKFKEERFGHLLDKETYEYFLRIAETLKTEHNDEEKAILAENVLKETEGNENDLTSHPLSGRVIESIVPWADWKSLKSLRDVFTDKRHWANFGCQAHVQEALIKDAGSRVMKNKEEKEECLEYIKQKSMFYLNNLEEQINELNLNHMTRTCLQVCSGYGEKDATPLLPEVVKEYIKWLNNWPQFPDIYKGEVVSGFLQVAIRSGSLCCPKSCLKFADTLIENCFTKDFKDEDNFFENISQNRLLESIIEISDAELYSKIYQRFLKGRIRTVSCGKNSNFVIVKLLKSCPGKIQFEPIFDEIGTDYMPFFEYPQILVALSESCLKCGIKQGDFIKSLKTNLECDIPNGDQSLIKCLLWMKPLNELDEKAQSSIHGSFILQNMLAFKKPIKIVEGILGLNFDDVKKLAEEPKGSRIFDAFMESKTVGEKSRDRLIFKFNDSYCDLAMTKFGSRVFDALWAKSSHKQKESIMKNMTRKIFSNQYGSKIASLIDLNTYLNDKKNWNPNKK